MSKTHKEFSVKLITHFKTDGKKNTRTKKKNAILLFVGVDGLALFISILSTIHIYREKCKFQFCYVRRETLACRRKMVAKNKLLQE